MSGNHYDTTKSIFSAPSDITEFQKADLITNSMARIKGTSMTVSLAVSNNKLRVWQDYVQYCMASI